MLTCPFRTSHYIAWHLSGMWCHRHRSWISCLHFFFDEILSCTGWNQSYFSSTDVIAEVRKKSGSGFLLSFIQPLSSALSSHREGKWSEDLSSNRDALLKEQEMDVNVWGLTRGKVDFKLNRTSAIIYVVITFHKDVFVSNLEVKWPSSSSSSRIPLPLEALAARGFSCWMMCMSDVTEWDTPLQKQPKKWAWG